MKHLLVHKNIRLLTALKKISLAGEKTLIVVNSKNVLQGTISDGDIRRNILRSNNLNNKDPLTSDKKQNAQTASLDFQKDFQFKEDQKNVII